MIFYIFLDNGVMNTPKRRILSFVFTVLCSYILMQKESYGILTFKNDIKTR